MHEPSRGWETRAAPTPAACFGDPDTVRHKVAVLREHCAAAGRDPADVRVTHLRAARVIADGERRDGVHAGTVEEHVGAYRALAEAGVQTVIVGLREPAPDAVERFAGVIAAFR